MKLYIAGPMTGYPEFNFPAFATAALELRALGHDVVSPAEVPLPCGCEDTGSSPACGASAHEWADFLRSDLIALLRHAEGIAVLPQWEASRGASLEVHVAQALGLPVHPVEAWLSEGAAMVT